MFVALCCTMLTENWGWLLFSAKFIPRLLTAEQREKRSSVIYTGGQNHRQDKKKGARQSKSNVKTMLGVFFDFRGLIPYEFVRRNPTVNQEYFLTVLRHLRERVRKKRPDLEMEHASATTHATRTVQQFNAINKIPSLPQALYSSNLSHDASFFLLSKLNVSLKWHNYKKNARMAKPDPSKLCVYACVRACD